MTRSSSVCFLGVLYEPAPPIVPCLGVLVETVLGAGIVLALSDSHSEESVESAEGEEG